MSHCEELSNSRHRAIFLTPEDADPATSKEKEPEEHPDDAAPGLILPDGSINWGCPCLGGMPTGPCGTEFRAAFECFHYSDSETKGQECLDKFMEMQDCMRGHPDLYGEEETGDKLMEGDLDKRKVQDETTLKPTVSQSISDEYDDNQSSSEDRQMTKKVLK